MRCLNHVECCELLWGPCLNGITRMMMLYVQQWVILEINLTIQCEPMVTGTCIFV